MKLWKAIFLTVALMLIIGAITTASPDNAKGIFGLFIFGTSLWMAFDSRKIEAKKYKSLFGMGPFAIFCCGWFIWIITFPGYLNLRYRIKNGLAELKPIKKA